MQGNHSGRGAAFRSARRAGYSFASIVLAAVASSYAAIGAAEDAATPAEQSVEPAESTAPADGGLAEIVVTAQRREQRLGDVGIAVTAMTGDTLAQLGVVNGSDIAQ